MNFRIGDKVRITTFGAWSGLEGKICIVSELRDFDSEYACRVKCIGTHWECLMLEREIEKVVIKGQQLLFSFMSE
jgi:hypothetical protein